jgi:alpha-D-xyloside xylohydrolase
MMDFVRDKNALDINDQYMFGKSFLVCPVTKPMYSKSVQDKDTTNVGDYGTIKNDEVYLPAFHPSLREGTGIGFWFDFWTGEKYTGGQTINKETPIDIIPLYIKAGSILPIGPEVQYALEKDWDNLEIRVYTGANGEFTLYEDENDNYNYEEGVYSTITFNWNDAKKVLTINDRKGSFPGMLKERRFNIVLVSKNNGTGMNTVEKFDKVIDYNGKKVEIKL